VSPWDDFPATKTQNINCIIRCHIASLKRWERVFQAFQIVLVRHTSNFKTAALGRFWHNPYLKLDDFPVVNTDILPHLHHLFERSKRPPLDAERERVLFTTYLLYSRGEIVNVVTGRDGKIMAYSVRKWRAQSMPLSSLSISARVKEWWIVEGRLGYPYIVGYYEKRSVIIDVHDWKFYETGAQKKSAWK
jgi:hypothetical protein